MDVTIDVPQSEEDERALMALLGPTYGLLPSSWEVFLARIGSKNLRLARRGNALVGGLGIYRFAQFFGGESVPCAGLCAVGTAIEHRSEGIARTLLTTTLRQMRDEGVALSALFASTQHPYRRLGFEHAATFPIYRARAEHLGPSPCDPCPAEIERARALPCRRVLASQKEIFRPIYDAVSRRQQGRIDRTDVMWDRYAKPYTGEAQAYVVGPEDAPTGYAIYVMKQPDRLLFDIRITDIAAATPSAARRLFQLFHDQRSVVDHVYWCAPYNDPFQLFLSEVRHTSVVEAERFYMRILDVIRALETRGYPNVRCTLTLAIRDDLFEANSGSFTVHIADRRAKVSKTTNAPDASMDVRALVPLYSGFMTPHELRANGMLEASDTACDTMASVFSSSGVPFTMDRF